MQKNALRNFCLIFNKDFNLQFLHLISCMHSECLNSHFIKLLLLKEKVYHAFIKWFFLISYFNCFHSLQSTIAQGFQHRAQKMEEKKNFHFMLLPPSSSFFCSAVPLMLCSCYNDCQTTSTAAAGKNLHSRSL